MRKKSKKAISSILVLFVLFQIVCPVSSYAIENGGQETQETTNESLVMDENTGKDEDNSAQDSSKDEENIVVMAAHQSEDYKYLSDLDYITENNWSYAGWGEIKKTRILKMGKSVYLLMEQGSISVKVWERMLLHNLPMMFLVFQVHIPDLFLKWESMLLKMV